MECTNKDQVNLRISVFINIQSTTYFDAKSTKIDVLLINRVNPRYIH